MSCYCLLKFASSKSKGQDKNRIKEKSLSTLGDWGFSLELAQHETNKRDFPI